MKKKILVVDDELSITRLLKLNLEQTGKYEVFEVNQGARALQMAQAFKPDLVILDVMMPDMDGSEIAASFKQDPDLKKTPVVFLTAAIKKEELGGSEGKIGGRTYIAKPLNVQGVISVIERSLPT
jgi:CheY-like chemotaxis protein